MKSTFSASSTCLRRAGITVAACTGGAAVLLTSRMAVHAQEDHAQEETRVEEEHDQPQETVTSDAAGSPVSEHQWEEVWEEEKGTVLRPYITSVRIAAQETAADVCKQWDDFKARTGLDHKWSVTKHHVTRYYWLVTGHQLGPQIAFAATTGVLAAVASRKVLRLPHRLALLSGGLATAALLPPYDQTLPYLKNRYETFEWAEVEKAVREKPVAYYKTITDDIKASLPFGLGKSKQEHPKVEEVAKETDEEPQKMEEEVKHNHHHHHHHHPQAKEEACCHDDEATSHKHEQAHSHEHKHDKHQHQHDDHHAHHHAHHHEEDKKEEAGVQ